VIQALLLLILLSHDLLGITRYLNGDAYDQWTARSVNGQLQWFLSDRMGSIQAVTDDAGNILESYSYSAFGQRSTTSTTPGFVSNEIGFTGREHDEETGLTYYRARYYEPSLGKFLSNDPLGFDAGDYNLSRYVMNDPLGWTDPDGKSPAIERRIVTKNTTESTSLQAARVGQQVHRQLQESFLRLNQAWRREVSIPGHGRADLVNFAEKIIVEIKPANVRGVLAGVKQLEMYVTGLAKPGEAWRLILILY
jgi:RHS repeat-associated protein